MTSPQALTGKRILLTTPAESGDRLEQALSAQGAQVVRVPLITLQTLDVALPALDCLDWLFFTSRQGVAGLMRNHPDPEHLAQLKIAAVGPKTALALADYGLKAEFVPTQFDGHSAAHEFNTQYPGPGLRILWPCGNLANPEVQAILSSRHALRPLVVYQTSPRLGEAIRADILAAQPFDTVVFTSPSAVRVYQGLSLPEQQACCASIGPATSRELRTSGGLNVSGALIEAVTHTHEGLAEAIVRHYQDSSTSALPS